MYPLMDALPVQFARSWKTALRIINSDQAQVVGVLEFEFANAWSADPRGMNTAFNVMCHRLGLIVNRIWAVVSEEDPHNLCDGVLLRAQPRKVIQLRAGPHNFAGHAAGRRVDDLSDNIHAHRILECSILASEDPGDQSPRSVKSFGVTHS